MFKACEVEGFRIEGCVIIIIICFFIRKYIRRLFTRRKGNKRERERKKERERGRKRDRDIYEVQL